MPGKSLFWTDSGKLSELAAGLTGTRAGGGAQVPAAAPPPRPTPPPEPPPARAKAEPEPIEIDDPELAEALKDLGELFDPSSESKAPKTDTADTSDKADTPEPPTPTAADTADTSDKAGTSEPPNPTAADTREVAPRQVDTREIAKTEAGALDLGSLPPPPFEPTDRVANAHYREYLQWLRHTFGVRNAFIADAHGLSLVDESSSPELVAAASIVGNGWQSVHEGLGLPRAQCFIVSLGDREWLHLLVEEGRWDKLSLGFLAEDPLSSERILSIREGFRSCIRPEAQDAEERAEP